MDDFGRITASVDLLDSTLRGDVREEHHRQRSPLGSDHLFVEPDNILKGGSRGWTIDEEHTMAPHQVPGKDHLATIDPVKRNTLTHNTLEIYPLASR